MLSLLVQTQKLTNRNIDHTLLHKLRELYHLSSLMKTALATKAVRLHWLVLKSRWRSVESVKVRMLGLSQETRNLHC